MEYFIIATFLLTPTYVLRFSLGGSPTNLLMVWIGVLWLVFAFWLLATRKVKDFIASIPTVPKPGRLFIELFLLAGVVALFVGGASQAKLAQFIVWFVQPISVFYITRYMVGIRPQTKVWLAMAFYLFLFASGVYAFVQYFTLTGLPAAWWGNSLEPKRALAFFAHPNSYALFVAPLLAFLIPDVMEKIGSWRKRTNLLAVLAWLVGAAGLLLSLSRGGWLGLVAAAAVYLFVIGRREYFKHLVIVGIAALLTIIIVPNLRYRLLQPFYGERSASARSVLWETGWHMVQDNPILGKGLLGADHNWNKYAVDPNLGHYPFPHNIFLDFWIDTGLFGLVSFILLVGFGLRYGIKQRTNLYAFGLTLFLVALLAHGQIDNPYLKNDLALVFWLVWGMVL